MMLRLRIQFIGGKLFNVFYYAHTLEFQIQEQHSYSFLEVFPPTDPYLELLCTFLLNFMKMTYLHTYQAYIFYFFFPIHIFIFMGAKNLNYTLIFGPTSLFIFKKISDLHSYSLLLNFKKFSLLHYYLNLHCQRFHLCKQISGKNFVTSVYG